jgi:hypothetical protein
MRRRHLALEREAMTDEEIVKRLIRAMLEDFWAGRPFDRRNSLLRVNVEPKRVNDGMISRCYAAAKAKEPRLPSLRINA